MEQLDKHFIAVIGGFWELDKTDATKAAASRTAGKLLGAELAKAGFGLVVYFSNDESLEPHVVEGYAGAVPPVRAQARFASALPSTTWPSTICGRKHASRTICAPSIPKPGLGSAVLQVASGGGREGARRRGSSFGGRSLDTSAGKSQWHASYRFWLWRSSAALRQRFGTPWRRFRGTTTIRRGRPPSLRIRLSVYKSMR